MPTKQRRYLYDHELEELPWHGITAENPPTPPKRGRLSHWHLPGLAPYAALCAVILVVATSDAEKLFDTAAHLLIGVLMLAAGALGRRVCEHRHHQVAVTVTLMIVEAYVLVGVVG